MVNKIDSGKVIIAGAGPGDPELIAIKAARALQVADLIIADKLVSRELIDAYAAVDAEIVFIARPAKGINAVPQKKANQLMVQYAQQGKTVVRLKGGDVSVFSDILEELQTLVEFGVVYELIPGISAALGAAAYAGIPLTAKEYASSVKLLTYQHTEKYLDSYWKDIAASNDTLVIYLSASDVDEIVEQLRIWKITSDKYMAVVGQATTSLQNVYVSNIYQHKSGKKFSSPALMIIGRVVVLHEQFSWLRNSNSLDSYFDQSVIEKEFH